MTSHLFIIDAPETFVEHNDTSTLLIEEARSRGQEVVVVNINEVGVKNSRVVVREQFVRDFDVVWVRKDPPIDMNYVQHLQLLNYERDNCFFVNDPMATLQFLDKASIFNFPTLIPETIVAKDASEVDKFLQGREKVVVKPLNGFSGNDVRIYSGGGIEIDEFVMVQEFLEKVSEGDTRVHICDGEVIGAIKRVPSNDDFRGNLHAGGTGVATELNDQELSVVETVGAWLKEQGVFFAGIDLIDGRLNEINITSPGIIIETNEVMNAQLEKEIFDRLERYV